MQWYLTAYGEQRLKLELDLLRIDFPQVKLLTADDQCIALHGKLGESNVCENNYTVYAKYPVSYPHTRPRVWLPEEEMPLTTPHAYEPENSELCLDHNDFSPDDTMSTVLGWAVQWCALYEKFLKTGEIW